MTPRILILDEFSSYLRFIKELLTNEGFEIACVEKEQDIEECLAHFNPEIILIDVYMNNGQGFIFLEKLSKKYKNTKPIIVLSSGKNVEDIGRAFNLGAYDYLIKPLNLRDLQNKVQQAITKQLFKRKGSYG